jgi:penicillin-binding protein 2
MTEGSRVRLMVVGVVVFAVFSALFARLWFLQVVSGNEVAAAVQTNSVRTVRIPAPRGEILDAKGNLLVDNAVVNAITVRRNLVGKERTVVVNRLAGLLRKPVPQIEKNLNDPRVSPYSAVPVATNVPFDQLAYVKEHQQDFPDVDAVSLTVRRYHLWGGMPVAPQVLGYVGEINGDELKARKGQGYALGDTVGKSGVEQSMEPELRGVAGYDKLEVDNTGRVVRVIAHKDPVPGDNVYLTIDANLQGTAQKALNDAMTQDRILRDPSIKDHFQTFNAPGGGFVLLDARDGSVVAMASEPDYDPNQFVQGNGIPTPTWKWLNDPAHAYPLTNRALSGLYAPGSTFKLVTATAMLQANLRTPNTSFPDTGSIKCCNGDVFLNDHGTRYGAINLAKALTVSSDAYFYSIGLQLWQAFHAGFGGNNIQDAARQYGFGSPTGVALADEAKGRVPDAAWKVAYNKANNPDPVSRAANSIWEPGDNIHLATGQGDLVVTPLQLASAYMTFADGGTRWVPRIVDKVTDYRGRLIRTYPAVQKPGVTLPAGSDAIKAGLEGVTTDPKGTAYNAFQGFPLTQIPVMAKTGTAQVQGKSATSVFVAVSNPGGPYSYVATSFVEEAGYGAAVSAPIVRHVFDAVYGLPSTPQVQIDAAANTAAGN